MKTEHEEQRELVSWFRKTFNSVRIFAIPNGGARGLATAARLKVEGVTAGVPDLFVAAWCLWVEMKRERGGVISPEQKDWLAYLSTIGHTTIVAKGCEDAKKQIVTFHETTGADK